MIRLLGALGSALVVRHGLALRHVHAAAATAAVSAASATLESVLLALEALAALHAWSSLEALTALNAPPTAGQRHTALGHEAAAA